MRDSGLTLTELLSGWRILVIDRSFEQAAADETFKPDAAGLPTGCMNCASSSLVLAWLVSETDKTKTDKKLDKAIKMITGVFKHFLVCARQHHGFIVAHCKSIVMDLLQTLAEAHTQQLASWQMGISLGAP